MLRLGIRVPTQASDEVVQELLHFSPNGVEERAIDEQTVEFSIYGAEGELPALPELKAVLPSGQLLDVKCEPVPDDWADRWRNFHRSVLISNGEHSIFVRPPWEAPREDPDVIDLVIDPGQAFGTGSHPTTRLSLQLLLTLENSGALSDWGCGSGVLAIAAARLGFYPVCGYDHEFEAVAATNSNARANGVKIEAFERGLLLDPLPVTETVTANLVKPLLLKLAAKADLTPIRNLILSGLLVEEGDEIAERFANHGIYERRRLTEGDWIALLLARD